MTVTAASFRDTFPAFGDVTRYPDPMVEMWLGIAVLSINAAKWGDLADTGVSLYAAHNLALEAQSVKAATRGGVPGGSVGLLNSKAAGGVSAGYDTTSTTEKDAGHWNSTTYGTRYYRLSRLMGAGPVQVGVTVTEVAAAEAAWPGPIFPPSPSTP